MSRCPLDGSVRISLDSDRYATVWKCPFCKTVSREEYEPDVTNDLNRSFDRGGDL